MSEQPRQTWDEMKKLYPNQWLMVVGFETNKFGDIKSGMVVGHGTGKTKLPATCQSRNHRSRVQMNQRLQGTPTF